MARLFGTDGVRGIANQELDGVLAFKLGKYGARVLREHFGKDGNVMISHDGRISADMLVSALAAGFCSEGMDVYLAGLLPTPGLAHVVKNGDYALGVMVSASHNTFEYNGIKFFNHNGEKLSDALEDEIEALVMGTIADLDYKKGKDLGRIQFHNYVPQEYLQFLIQQFPIEGRGRKLGIDCANGATQELAVDLFTALGFEITVVKGIFSNGMNINDSCGSTHPEFLARSVEASHCDLGIAFDGDGDRIIAVDRKGKVIDGDQILAVLALASKKLGKLKNNTLVATMMSNLGLIEFTEKNGINLELTNVGDRYVLAKMLEEDLNLGGEQSGHIILRDYQATGDGMLSALALIYALDELDMDLSEVDDIIRIYPQVMKNVHVSNKVKPLIQEDMGLQNLILQMETELDGKGRVFLRPSGTEPVIRVMTEADSMEMAENVTDTLVRYIEKCYTK